MTVPEQPIGRLVIDVYPSGLDFQSTFSVPQSLDIMGATCERLRSGTATRFRYTLPADLRTKEPE